MEITQVYIDGKGESYFEDAPMPLDEKVMKGFTSHEIQNVKTVLFQSTYANQQSDSIRVEGCIYLVVLGGSFELEVSSGAKRTFGVGEVILLDDRTGKGHKVRTLDETVYCLVIKADVS